MLLLRWLTERRPMLSSPFPWTSQQQMASGAPGTCGRQGGRPWTGCVRVARCSDTQSTQNVGVRRVNTETGKLSRVSRKHNARSSPDGFATFCYSACLSHFAAPFLITPTEASGAEICVRKPQPQRDRHLQHLTEAA